MNQQLEAAAKAEGFDIVFADAAQDNAKQVSDIENFLTQGVDLLVVSTNEAAPLTDEINKVWRRPSIAQCDFQSLAGDRVLPNRLNPGFAPGRTFAIETILPLALNLRHSKSEGRVVVAKQMLA